MTAPAMLSWQYRQILIELDQLQRHGSDPDCPCSQAAMGEFCLSKHAVALHGLAGETMAMVPEGERAELARLGDEALEWHLKFKDALCRPEDTSGVVEWAREWRKDVIEPIYYACKVGRAKASAEVARKKPWQMRWIEYRNDFIDKLRQSDPARVHAEFYSKMADKEHPIHKAAVLIALTEGKPVPAEVLAEYPDLAARVAKPVASVKEPPSACTVEGMARSLAMKDDCERVYALLLDRPGGKVLGIHLLSTGKKARLWQRASAPVPPVADIILAAQQVGARAAVLVHNHPSGIPDASPEDQTSDPN